MIHTFYLNGYYFAIDVCSGAVHLLDKLAYDMLNMLDENMQKECPENVIDALKEEFPLEDITGTYSELYSLYIAGQLFSKDNYEQFTDMMKNAPIKSICLHIAHDCNLRCEYCFASTGDFGEGRKMMTLDTGRRAIDFVLENSGTRKNLELDFFGGEPLMNWDTVKEIVKYGREREKEYNKHFRFTITTNGLLLDDDSIDFINAEMSNVVLSLDGRPEVNDRLRKTVNGKGSYDIISEKFKKLVDKRLQGDKKEYYIRGTYTKYNLDFANDALHIADMGFDQLSVEPVIADPDKPYAITLEDLPQIFDEYEHLAKELIKRKKEGRGFNFFHFMMDLDQGPCAIKRLRGCGCGNEYVSITPDGDIYPCHQFVGHKEWKMGNIEDGSFNSELKAQFAKANIYEKEECKKCWARFYCSGGCNANNFEYSKNILTPNPLSCEIEKKRVECAIMIKAAMAQ